MHIFLLIRPNDGDGDGDGDGDRRTLAGMRHTLSRWHSTERGAEGEAERRRGLGRHQQGQYSRRAPLSQMKEVVPRWRLRERGTESGISQRMIGREVRIKQGDGLCRGLAYGWASSLEVL